MSIRIVCVALAMIGVLAISPSYADQGRKGDRKNPYRGLFGAAGDRLSTTRQLPDIASVPVPPTAGSVLALPTPQSAPTREPRVVCGMTVIPTNPDVDPGIRREMPESDVKHHIRIVPPSICQQ